MKTFSPKAGDLTHNWYIVDAQGQTLGRLATKVATYLTGKHKAGFAPHVDGGDNVIIINAAQVGVTGNKLADKMYYHHSGYPGGVKGTNLATLLERHPTQAVEKAIAGMLPKNRLQADRLHRLKVYAGAEHPHAGQSPVTLEMT